MKSSKKNYKDKGVRRKEEKPEQPELPKYRDRAKERRDEKSPDYEATELGSFHAVAPPGNVDLGAADVHKLSIEKSKYLGGDLEHTHLVKGLDYALLNKVRSGMDRKPDDGDDTDDKSRVFKLPFSSNGDSWFNAEVKNLGNRALFFSTSSSSFSVEVSENSGYCKPNRIYFINNKIVSPMVHLDVGMYNMEDGTVDPNFGNSFKTGFQEVRDSPLWIQPS